MPLSTVGFNGDKVVEIADQLFDLPEAKMSKSRTEGGWSRKQILGHLIDSASVNHQRIIESQLSDSIEFEGYKHERWVELAGYQEMEWEEIVTMWCAYNMQMCTLVERIPLDVLDQLHEKHSYDRTAFRELSADTPSTLGYLIEDYFAHVQYHLDQIFES